MKSLMPTPNDRSVTSYTDTLCNGFTLEQLRHLADLMKVLRPKVPRKRDFAAYIARSVLVGEKDGPLLPALLGQLNRLQTLTLAETIYSKSLTVKASMIELKYGGSPRWFEARGVLRSSDTPTLLALFLCPRNAREDDVYTCDEALACRLRELIPPPVKTKIISLDKPAPIKELVPLFIREREADAQEELTKLLREASLDRLSFTSKGKVLSAVSLRRIAASLPRGDYFDDSKESRQKLTQDARLKILTEAWLLILHMTGMLEIVGTKVALTRAGKEARLRPPAAVLRDLWFRWLDQVAFDEAELVVIVSTFYYPPRFVDCRERRRKVVGLLSELQAGRWYQISDVISYCRQEGGDFSVIDWSSSWASVFSAYDPRDTRSWMLLQGRYLLVFFFYIAATLGIIDVAYHPPQGVRGDYSQAFINYRLPYLTPADGLASIRITNLGAVILGQTIRHYSNSRSPQKALSYRSGLILESAGGSFPRPVEFMLDRCGKWQSETSFAFDRQIALRSTAEGFRIGELAKALTPFLKPFPAELDAFIRDVAHRSSAFSLGEYATIIECSCEEIALNIVQAAANSFRCLLATPTTLVVPSTSLSKFRQLVKKLGYPLPGE